MGESRDSFSYHKLTMNALAILSVVLLCCLVAAQPSAIDGVQESLQVLNTPLASNASTEMSSEDRQGHNTSRISGTEMSSEDRLKELRIEMVKLQILSKLNMKEPPSRPSTPPSQFTRETIDILLRESEERERSDHSPIDSGERLVIHARNHGVKCSSYYDGGYCRAFHFEMSLSFDSSSVDLWIFRTDNQDFSDFISISVSSSNVKDEKLYEKYFRKVPKMGWNKLDLPGIEVPGPSGDAYQFLIELSGPAIENQGERRPFLMVTKLPHSANRPRRDISCDSNESCCLRPLRVYLADIGFNWVVYPDLLEVNMCTGKCRMDHGEMNTHYERAMTKVLENNSSLHDSLGVCWTLCCKPKQMEAVRVIYNDTEGIIHDQYIPELAVTSCGCS